MSHQSGTGRRRGTFALASVAALALAGVAGTTSYAAEGSGPKAPASPRASVPHLDRGFYDVRTTAAQTQASLLRTAEATGSRPSARAFAQAPVDQTVTDIDPNTGTVRMRTRLDGFLTPASSQAPRTIALDYVAANHTELGLSAGDLNTFHLKRVYRDITGAHHLFFTQRIGNHTVISNGLTATVNKAGHLLTVGGSPVTQATSRIAPVSSSPALRTAGEALDEAQDATVPGADVSQDGATGGLFVVGRTAHPAYQAIVMSSDDPAMVVLDANTGQVLQRRPLVNYENSTGRAFRFFPGAHKGGRQVKVDFTQHHWLSRSAKILSGNNSHTYSDVNDNNRPSKSEEVRARSGHAWNYPLKPFKLPFAKSFCGKPWPCSWNPNQRNSWKTNRAQNATQVFYFVNTWHDHLKAAPIGFTEAAGNFQRRNHGKPGKGGDAVDTQTDDGANTDHGLPDGAHIDNANMGTPPDGRSPQMQMYLQHQPFTSYPGGDPFSPTNVGDEADTVYHEYTHGLSNRLNVDVQGRSTLGGIQAGAMGEAWSDWYAMDYLVRHHLQRDRAAQADVRLFLYDGKGVNYDRTEPIDCKVGQKQLALQGSSDRTPRRLHLRRLREGRRWTRGPRRRRDLGPDPVEPARRHRLEQVRGCRHPGDGAGAVQPVVPRHAQRDPGGRHLGLRGQAARRHLEGLRQPRDGLLRRVVRRLRHPSGRRLPHPARLDRDGHDQRCRQEERQPGHGSDGATRLPGCRCRQPDHDDRRHRSLHAGCAGGHLPQAPGLRGRHHDPAHVGHRHRRRDDGQLHPVTRQAGPAHLSPSAAHASAIPAQTSSADTAPESTTSRTCARVTT